MDTLALIVENIGKKNKIHANNLRAFLDNASDEFKVVAEDYLSHYCKFIQDDLDLDMEYIVDSYLTIVEDTTIEQIRFMRTGKYRYSNFEETNEHVYSNKEYMQKYMIGLALSQFLWENHKEIFEFYMKNINKKGNRFLEIGCGHGMFFIEAIKQNKFKFFKAVDLSPSSVELTKKFVTSYFGKIPFNIDINLQDIFYMDGNEKYDFINMGEVLEHVENPQALLDRIAELLEDSGRAYISTCANCPAVDHIFLYKDINEIKNMIDKAGLSVVQEISLKATDLRVKNIGIVQTMNYAAIIEKK